MKIQDILKKHFNELLTEEANNEITVMFDTLVESKVAEKVVALQEAKEKELEEKYEEELKGWKEDLIENMNDYINLSVNDFLIENEGVITENYKAYTADKVLGGIKDLLKECYIDVPDSNKDMLKELQESVSDLKEKLNDETNKNIDVQRQVDEYKKAMKFQKLTESLTDTEKEKVFNLIKTNKYDTVEALTNSVNIIMENLNVVDKEEEVLTEDIDKNLSDDKGERFEIDKYFPKYL